MNRISVISIALVGLLFNACSKPVERTIEMPDLTAANTPNLDVRSVQLTDSSTVLKMHVNFRPNYWIGIAPESKIIADGQAYTLMSAEGITPGEQFWMPENGETEFTLTFPAIPLSTEKIDFTEGTPDGWEIFGIDISGKTDKGEYAAGLPKGFVKNNTDDINLNPVLKAEDANMTFHVLGYQPKFGNKLEVVLSNMTEYRSETIKLDPAGSATLTTMLYGPTFVNAGLSDLGNYYNSSVTILPGEKVDIYIDPRVTVTPQMKGRDDSYSLPVSSYSNSTLSALGLNAESIGKYNLDIYNPSSPFSSWKATPDQFVNDLLALRSTMSDSIKASTLPEKVKQFVLSVNEAMTLMAIVDSPIILNNYYYYTHEDTNPRDSIKEYPGEKQIEMVANAVDFSKINNIALALGGSLLETDWSKYTDNTRFKELHQYSELYGLASKGWLRKEQIESAKQMSDPFYVDALTKRNEEAIASKQKAKKLICELPDVSDDKLFGAIVEKYKGKVVLVDLWNTWCGPCRAALKANEPLKTGELSDEDIEWVYIADESSDFNKYIDMIPDIKGHHYLVNADQIAKIREQFEVDGIPFYILVDRSGTATRHPDFRNHDELIKGIKSAL